MKRLYFIAIGLVALGICIVLWKVFFLQPNRNAIVTKDLFAQYPWLNLSQASAWRQLPIDTSKKPLNTSDLGCFPIGNGYVFTTLGLDYPLNTLKNTIGPHYQRRVGFLGMESIKVRQKGKALDLPIQEVWKVRRAAIVVTKASRSDVALYTVDFVPPKLKAVVRIIVLANKSENNETLRKAQIVCQFQGLIEAPAKGKLILSRGNIRVCAGVLNAKAFPEGTNLVIPVPNLRPGRQALLIHYIAISKTEKEEQKTITAIHSRKLELLTQTRNWWREWLKSTTTVECSNKKISDLLDDIKILIKVQQSEPFGPFSPMYGYTFCWIRDSNGPIRYFLSTGKFEEVKRALDYYYYASLGLERVPNCVPLDIDITKLQDKKIDWSKVPVEPAEVSSFIVLQHYWYYKATGDLKTIRDHYDYLKRNIYGQKISKDLLLPFHGDETYMWPGEEFYKSRRIFPKGYIKRDQFSADSSFEFVKAAEALSEMAKDLGKSKEAAELSDLAKRAREACEKYYWLKGKKFYAPALYPSSTKPVLTETPFANINLSPLWIRYLKPEDEKAVSNLLATWKYLGRADGLLKTTPEFSYYVGMTPGMWLYNLAALDHPYAEKALEGLLKATTPSGEFTEMHLPNHKPAGKGDFWGRNRVRPWESGINAEAVLFYLTGFEPEAKNNKVRLMPHLPAGCNHLEVKNLWLGNQKLDLTVQKEKETITYFLTNRGSQTLQVEFISSLPEAQLRSLEVNGKRVPLGTLKITRKWDKRQIPIYLYLKPKESVRIVLR